MVTSGCIALHFTDEIRDVSSKRLAEILGNVYDVHLADQARKLSRGHNRVSFASRSFFSFLFAARPAAAPLYPTQLRCNARGLAYTFSSLTVLLATVSYSSAELSLFLLFFFAALLDVSDLPLLLPHPLHS